MSAVEDVVTEAAGAGTDSVLASISYSLGANLENLTLTGSAAINAVGNAAANALTGNAAANLLDGGAGADTMSGGLGDDNYVVDNAGDVVAEGVGAGTDTVQASVSYAITTEVENLTLTGTATNGTGNALANFITGNDQNNTLDGGSGIDTVDYSNNPAAGNGISVDLGAGTASLQRPPDAALR